jgi:glycosyltransferase involved in cell wall biosynthesis
MTMVQRVLREGDVRHGATGEDLTPADARCLLQAWLSAVELDHLDERGLIAHMQQEGFSHSDLYRRACRLHEHKLRVAVERAVRAVTGESAPDAPTDANTASSIDEPEVGAAAAGLFESCIAAIPYAPATAFLSSEQSKLARYATTADGEPPRIAILADGIGSMHGVTRTIEEIRRRGVPGFEIEVVGTDPDVDRRLSAVAEFEVPFYAGLRIGVPSLSAAVQTLSEGDFDALHVCSPGPVGIAGALLARALGLPLVGSYHTELTAYAKLRSQSQGIGDAMGLAVSAFYGACDLVLSPSPASDEALAAIGMAPAKLLRWDRGVDTSRFDPALRDDALRLAWAADANSRSSDEIAPHACAPSASDGELVNVLYAGRITREKGAELLADAFLAAHERDPRLHLVLAGGGPEQAHLSERVGEHASFLGWLEGEELARAYASADVFFFPSATDTFGQVILEAQASGLPVLAVAAGGPLALVENGVTGLLHDADAEQLTGALVELAGSPRLRERLAQAALIAVRERTWERALERLAAGYLRALGDGARPSFDTKRLVA